MIGRDDVPRPFVQRHHRREYLGVAHELVEMPLLPGAGPVEAWVRRVGIPHGDVGPEGVAEAGVAPADVARPHDPHPLPVDRAARERRVVTELLTPRFRDPHAVRRVVVPRRQVVDNFPVQLRDASEPTQRQREAVFRHRLTPESLARVPVDGHFRLFEAPLRLVGELRAVSALERGFLQRRHRLQAVECHRHAQTRYAPDVREVRPHLPDAPLVVAPEAYELNVSLRLP